MAKIAIKGFILKSKDSWNSDFLTFHNTEMLESYLTVCPHTIEFEMPEDFNPVLAEIDGLIKQKNAFMASIAAINDRISNLQCLEFNPTEPAAGVVESDSIPF
jgi:hypothetical protein